MDHLQINTDSQVSQPISVAFAKEVTMNYLNVTSKNPSAQEMTECRLFLYYANEPNDEGKALVQTRLQSWSEDLQGGEVGEYLAQQGSWEQIFFVWLPSAIASAIVGWFVRRGLDALVPPRGGNGKQIPAPSEEQEPSSMTANQTVTSFEPNARNVEFVSESETEDRYANLGNLLGFIPDHLRPDRVTFVMLGPEGAPARMISLCPGSSNRLLAVGTNDDIMRWATEITFPKEFKGPEA